MRRFFKIIILSFLISIESKADIIYSPFTTYGLVASIEGIGGYEKSFSRYNTIHPWAGFGVVSAFREISHPAYGGEIGIELRQYFKGEKFTGLNLGLYSGLALMSYPTFSHGNVRRHNSFGFVPGIKLTYKININSWLVSEPYLSFSTPFYSDNDNKLFDHIFHNDPGLIW